MHLSSYLGGCIMNILQNKQQCDDQTSNTTTFTRMKFTEFGKIIFTPFHLILLARENKDICRKGHNKLTTTKTKCKYLISKYYFVNSEPSIINPLAAYISPALSLLCSERVKVTTIFFYVCNRSKMTISGA